MQKSRISGDDKSLARMNARNVVVHLVSSIHGIKPDQLLNSSRCQAPIAGARQTAMYLAHTLCGLSQNEVGEMFGRDRTTVAHACRLIEDMRDCEATDRRLAVIEYAVSTLCRSLPLPEDRAGADE